jgi:adenosylhomocysteine nucleosidase
MSDSATAFVCAMPMELRPVVRELGLQRMDVPGVDTRSGTLDGRPVVAIVTGMGPALAQKGLTALLEAVSVDRVMVVGITGAVDNDTPIGTVIRPAVVVDGHTGTEYTPESPGQGKLWTTDSLITDQSVVAELKAQGVVALDMETAALGAICQERGIPWSVFRVISDRASDGSIDDEVFHMSNQDGSPNGRAVVRYFLRHPGKIPTMTRLARGAQLATTRAARAAIDAARATSG